MAANSIGAITFDAHLEGPDPVRADAVEIWQRDGLDTEGLRKIGKRPTECVWRMASYFASENDANTHAVACMALRATIVTAINSHNRSFTNTLVEDVSVAATKTVIKDAATKYRVESQYKLRRVGT